MEKIFRITDLNNIIEKFLLSRLKKYSIITFEGPLGVGKTTFITSLLKTCGVTDIVTSPTFNYVNKYITSTGLIFYHFDLYRISSIDDFIELGFDEYLYEKSVINLIEWPAVIEDLLKQEEIFSRVCSVKLSYIQSDTKSRLINICE